MLGHRAPLGPVAPVAGADEHDVALTRLLDPLRASDPAQLIGRYRLPFAEERDGAMAGHVVELPARPDRPELARVALQRPEVAEVCLRRAAVPVVVGPDRHVGERVDVGAGVGRPEDDLAHVAETCVVGARSPRLLARGADPGGRAVAEHLEARVAWEDGHAAKARLRERVDAALVNETRRLQHGVHAAAALIASTIFA